MTVMSWLYEQWFGLHAKFQAATGPQLSRASRENQGPEVREDSLPVSSQQCLMWWPLQAAGRGLHVTGSGREACGCLDGCGAQNKGGHSLGDCRGEPWALSLEPLITRTAAQGPHGTFLLTSVADQGSRVGRSGRGLSVPWGDTVFQKSHHDLWWARGSLVRASECGWQHCCPWFAGAEWMCAECARCMHCHQGAKMGWPGQHWRGWFISGPTSSCRPCRHVSTPDLQLLREPRSPLHSGVPHCWLGWFSHHFSSHPHTQVTL